MGEAKTVTTVFSGFHLELIGPERLRFNQLWKPLERRMKSDGVPEVTFNAVGFAHHPDEDLFSVFATFGDGTDEVFLEREDFLKELRRHTVGGDNA